MFFALEVDEMAMNADSWPKMVTPLAPEQKAPSVAFNLCIGLTLRPKQDGRRNPA